MKNFQKLFEQLPLSLQQGKYLIQPAEALFMDGYVPRSVHVHFSEDCLILIIDKKFSLWFFKDKYGKAYRYDGWEIGKYHVEDWMMT